MGDAGSKQHIFSDAGAGDLKFEGRMEGRACWALKTTTKNTASSVVVTVHVTAFDPSGRYTFLIKCT